MKWDFTRLDYRTIADAEYDEGFQEGQKKGLREGQNLHAVEVARRMLAKNKPLEEIAEFSGLAEELIHAILLDK